MRSILVVVMLMVGCGDDAVVVAPDAGADAEVVNRCLAWHGESCTSVEPRDIVNTVCADGAGWCVDDVCKPMCSDDCERCGGHRVYAKAGGCYCSK